MGKVCAEDERAGADHSGGLRCPSSLCGGWGRGVAVWAHPRVSGCGLPLVGW